jgi:drug/metabolite transporter (DMT)-like permease
LTIRVDKTRSSVEPTLGTEERKGLIYVGLAAFLFSTSPVLTVWADPLSPFIKTWARMLIGAVAVGLAAWLMSRRSATDSLASVANADATPTSTAHRRPVMRFMLYGLIAALHFLCAIASLSYTTAAHSLAIIYTAPIFVTLCSALFLKEHIRSRQWLGVCVAVVGIAVLTGLEPRMNPQMAFGDALALGSAITFGFYSIAGRYERARYPLLVYASRVYGAATLWLMPFALLAIPGTPAGAWGFQQVASLFGLGLGPLALGHTLYNASLRRVHATYVNIIASQEVTGGILLSWLFLGQVPSFSSLVGAFITLLGIGIVLRYAPGRPLTEQLSTA